MDLQVRKINNKWRLCKPDSLIVVKDNDHKPVDGGGFNTRKGASTKLKLLNTPVEVAPIVEESSDE